MPTDIAPLSQILGALEAAGEPTRLRLLALLAEAEITVSELVAILGQSQPRLDPTFVAASSVVVEDAANPDPSNLTVGTVRQDRGVLAWNLDLVVETIRNPAANGVLVETALVHREVEGVMDVIEALHPAEPGFEVLGQSSISMPS